MLPPGSSVPLGCSPDAAGGQSCCQGKPCSLLLCVQEPAQCTCVCVCVRVRQTQTETERRREDENMNEKSFLRRVQGALANVPWGTDSDFLLRHQVVLTYSRASGPASLVPLAHLLLCLPCAGCRFPSCSAACSIYCRRSSARFLETPGHSCLPVQWTHVSRRRGGLIK